MEKQAQPRTRRRRLRRVALAFPTHFAHLPAVVRGIARYAQQHGNWLLTTSGEAFDLPVQSLARWHGDGIISYLQSDADAAAARRLHVPVVTFVGLVRQPGVPRVMMDHAAIGRLAADHLLGRGFRHFAFYGLEGLGYSADRQEAFAQRIAKRGFTADHYLSPSLTGARGHATADPPGRRSDALLHTHPWDDEMEALAAWLERLPTPVGVFAANDSRARLLADACRLVGRRVPQNVAIIGVDNYEIACEFGSPTLTSVACDWTQLGFAAARLLDRLMHGGRPPARDQLLQPSGVVARQSTDVMIVDHPAVARAVDHARNHLNEPFGVEALVQAAAVSRRHLEIAFFRSLGCTPAHYLAKLRVEKAKDLLQSTDLTLTSIARDCGFTDLRHFRRLFQRLADTTPRKFRKLSAIIGSALP